MKELKHVHFRMIHRVRESTKNSEQIVHCEFIRDHRSGLLLTTIKSKWY